MKTPSIGWSHFCLERQKDRKARRFVGSPEALLRLVRKHWRHRRPGSGRSDLTQVVIVPIREKNIAKHFRCGWVPIGKASRITGKVVRRQKFEDPFVQLRGKGDALPVTTVDIVLYSRATLLEDGGSVSGSFDWEIVAILTGPWANPPMDPLTMARNYLRKPGGTFANYTATQFAEAIYFWAGFLQAR